MTVDEATKYAAEIRGETDDDTPREGYMHEVIETLADEIERLRAENTRLRRLVPTARAARRYSTATRDPGGESSDVRAARHLECNRAWRDLNDQLADARVWRDIDEL